jgi:hypothetical protein
MEREKAGTESLRRLTGVLEVLSQLGIFPELWKSQNCYYLKLQELKAGNWANVESDWKTAFLELGKLLKVAA